MLNNSEGDNNERLNILNCVCVYNKTCCMNNFLPKNKVCLFLLPDAGVGRTVWTDAAQLLWQGQDGFHDGVCRGHGCRRHVRNFLLSQVWRLSYFWVIYNTTYSVTGILAEKLLNCFNRVFCSFQDRHEGSRVDGWSWEDDDAKRRHVRNLHVDWDGHPLLRSH